MSLISYIRKLDLCTLKGLYAASMADMIVYILTDDDWPRGTVVGSWSGYALITVETKDHTHLVYINVSDKWYRIEPLRKFMINDHVAMEYMNDEPVVALRSVPYRRHCAGSMVLGYRGDFDTAKIHNKVANLYSANGMVDGFLLY